MFFIQTFILVFTFGLSAIAFGASGITYHGRLLKPDGKPVQGQVQFRLQIRTPGSEDCLLYEELQSLDLTEKSGVFSISIGDNSGIRQDSYAAQWNLFGALSNRKEFSFDTADCTGVTSYTPNPADNRTFRVLFNDGTFTGWEALPIQTINFIPMAIETYAVGGFPASSLLRVETAGALGTAAPINSAQYTELLALINGSSSQYSSPNELNGSVLPSIGSGQSVRWSGSAWEAYTPPANTSLPTCIAGQVLTSNGSALTCTSNGLTSVSGNDITSGTVGGSTAWNTSGNITTTGSISATGAVTGGSFSGSTMSTRNIRIFESTNTNFISIQAPAGLNPNYTLTLPTDDGGSGQVLSTNGTGTLSWVTPATGIVNLSHIRSTVNPLAHVFPSVACSTSETLRYNSLTGAYECSTLSLPATAVTGAVMDGGNSPSATLVVGTNNNNHVQIETNGTAKMTVLSGGNIGVGTTNPSARFHVQGTIKLADGGEACSVAADGGMIRYNGGNLAFCNGTSWQTLGISGASLSSLNGLTTPSQVLAVGTTGTAPGFSSAGNTHTLNIPMASTAGVTAGLISKTDYDAFNAKLSAVAGSTLTSGRVWVGNGSNQAAAVAISGDATLSNSGALTLKNTGTAGTYSKVTTDAQGRVVSGAALALADLPTGLVLNGGNTTGAPLVVGTNETQSVQIETGGTAKVTILNDGRVGIGTAAPAARLDVAGSVRIADGGEACTAATAAGTIRYAGGSLSYCNGSAWQTLGLSGAGLTTLNGLNASAQTFAVGTSGTAPAVVSAASTHTLNIPMASSAGVTAGLISKAQYDLFNAKLSAVTEIQGTPVSATDPTAAGQVLKYNGTSQYAPGFIGLNDIRSTVNSANNLFPSTCTSAQTLVFNAVTGQFACTNIAINVSQVSGAGTGDIRNGGNTTGAAVTVGTNDAQSLHLETAGTTRLTVLSSGLTGIGTTNPGSALHVNGTVRLDQICDQAGGNCRTPASLAAGVTSAQVTAALGYTPVNKAGDTMLGRLGLSANGLMIASKADISTRTDSGFFQTDTPTTAEGWPVNGGWYHLMSATHSNDANYYSMQFAGDFYNSNNVYYRTTNGSGATGWNRLWHSGNLTNLNQLTNGPGYITGVTSAMVTSALGYTPMRTDAWMGSLYFANDGRHYGTIFRDSNDDGFYMDPNGVSVLNDVRASIYYDRDDTNFYMNPNGHSQISRIRTNATWDGYQGGVMIHGNAPTVTMQDTDTNIRWMMHNNNDTLHFHRANTAGGTDWDTKVMISADGNIWSKALGDWFTNRLGQDVRAGSSPNFQNIYLGYNGSWLSDRLNQDVRNGSSPTFHSVYSNDWFRVNGNGGLHWQNHGGGLQMYDTSWIRTTGSKGFYVQGGPLKSDGKAQISTNNSTHELEVGGSIANNGQYISRADNNAMMFNIGNVWHGGSGWYWRRFADINNLYGSYTDTMVLDPSGSLWVANTYLASSDERLKENITAIPDSLRKLASLEGVSYEWIDPERPQGKQIGLIAQEVQKVFPEVVQEDKDGYLAVSYQSLVAPIVNALKEVRDWMVGTDERIAELEAENKMMKKYLCEKDPAAEFCG